MDILARVRKNNTAEIRVTRETYMGRQVVNIRVWCVPADGGELVPSRKGLTFDASKWRDLLAQLNNQELGSSAS